MKRRLRDHRVQAVVAAVIAFGVGCVVVAPRARAELRTEQTVAMVRAGKFAELDRYYGAIQAAYAKGSISDERLRLAFRHFYDDSPDLAARYASWVKEMPNSYVAHLASAIYYVRVGEASRGDRFIADTSEAQLDGMGIAFARASAELRTSLPLDKKPLLSVFYELDIGKFEGDATRNRQLLQDSLAIDRRNYIVRQMYLQTLQTAWGGSTQQIEAFLAESRNAGSSARQVRRLSAMVFADEAWVDEFDRKNYKRAAAEYLEAARLSGDDACLLCAGNALTKAKEFPAAARVLTQYLARNPESTDALGQRGYVYLALGRASDAVRDYERAADLGDAYSQYTLGTMYLIGEFGLPRDGNKAFDWLHRAAAQGYQPAMKLMPPGTLPGSQRTAATRSPAS